jgi:uncharacterized Zn-finger protein
MTAKKNACTKRRYEVTMAQIRNKPLSCPMAGMEIWDAHPKVFLPIMKTGRVECPYCDAEYILTDFDPKQSADVTDTASEFIKQINDTE